MISNMNHPVKKYSEREEKKLNFCLSFSVKKYTNEVNKSNNHPCLSHAIKKKKQVTKVGRKNSF